MPYEYIPAVAVDQSWARVVTWLQANAPVTAGRLRPAAGSEALTAAEAVCAVPWTDDLRGWYTLHDGEFMQTLWRCVLPHWAILPLEGVIAETHMWAELSDGEQDDGTQAGETSFAFLPQFVPVATDGCGNSLFVDLRPGPLHGCVTEYSAEDPTGDPSWPSIGRMLESLADSLAGSTECAGWTPSVIDGELNWELVDAE